VAIVAFLERLNAAHMQEAAREVTLTGISILPRAVFTE